MHNKKVEFNRLKRKLDHLTVEHRMLTDYLSIVEDAIIQEFRQYIHPKCGQRHARKRPYCPPLRTDPSISSSSSPPLLSRSSSTTNLSPISTPLHEKHHISFITHTH
ncbi:hypothetical protein BCR42DRAFT_428325 [Absidia repens]|uniref:Uncharacterized protein n=1 Tax=Absidia repens TaxID=90262 RepID=A0A1X2HYX7_9FUNG|nr:hypothetical protein BCR42DRAFT_428325 [Absidia repens]